MTRLGSKDLDAALRERAAWAVEGVELTRTFGFADFVAAIAFVDRLAELAEAAAHHPDIDVRYNRVRIALTTHDEGGITEKDLALATQLDSLV